MKKIEKKTWKGFEILKWSEMDFALWKSTKSYFFADFAFLTCEIKGRNSEKIIFLEKNLENFENYAKFHS